MATIIDFPVPISPSGGSSRLRTAGGRWTHLEKKLIDQAEFFEAMILVLNDVKLQNIQRRDYAMMEIVSEEIPRYQQRLNETREQLSALRTEYEETRRTEKETRYTGAQVNMI